MKDIIKKVIICVLVAVIAIGVAVSFLKGDEPDTQQTTTSAAGTNAGTANTPAPSQPQGNVNANATTNNSGVQQPSSGSAVQNTTGNQAVTPSQGDPAAPSSPEGNANAVPSTQPGQPVQPNVSNPQQSTSSPFNPQPVQPGQPVQPANKVDIYQDIFASGKFIMKVNDPDLGPVTMAMSGNKMFIDASMEGLTLKMLYDGDKPSKENPNTGTWYIIIDQIRKYSPMPSDMIGDMNVEEITKDFAKGDNNTVYTKSVETVNGEQLEVESCVDSNGNTTKYYFRGDQLVRSDSVSPSGEVSSTEFQEVSGNVDDSLFAIPDGYAKLDISWLLKMIG